MSLPATAQLEFINQAPLEAAETLKSAACSERQSPHPELAGCKVRVTGTTPIYVVDRKGYRRLIPFPLTFLNLFKDAAMLHVLVSSSIADISEGLSLG